MKLLASLLVLLLAGSSCLAQSPERARNPASALPAAGPSSWSIVGKWRATEATWSDTLTFSPDGTFVRDVGVTGRWTLAMSQNQLILILAWNGWPAETVTMIDSDTFHGQVPNGALDLQRVQPPAVETRTWRQGEPALRLLRKEEGFCALSMVTGCFQGGGEIVKVYIGDDGYWYLGGQSGQEGVAAQCIIVRYRGKP